MEKHSPAWSSSLYRGSMAKRELQDKERKKESLILLHMGHIDKQKIK